MPSSSDNSDNVINNEEINIMNQERNLQEWNLPLVPTRHIYKQSTFSNLSFLSNYTINTPYLHHLIIEIMCNAPNLSQQIRKQKPPVPT
jgi:hypothetical protein